MSGVREIYEPLTTARLELREPRAEYAPGIFEAFSSDPEVTRYLRWRPQHRLEEARESMRMRLARLADASELSWIVFLRDEDSVAGVVSLWPALPAAELGFAFARALWGRGLATEAVRAVLDWALRRLHADRVWAACDVENVASQRVLQKLGMNEERLARAHAVHPNLGPEPRDCYIYAVDTASA